MSNPLHETARDLVAPGRGILAADESAPTIKRRFDTIGLESTETNRRDWRQLLFTADGIGDWISGVILFEETLAQNASDGRTLVDVLTSNGVIPGVKVDKGAKDLAGSPNEKVTEGLDGMRERLEVYREQGARFTKWRAVIDIAEDRPTDYCLDVNAHALARFAALSQEAGLVPIVEPEVLMDGDHDIAACAAATEAALLATYAALATQQRRLARHAAQAQHGALGQERQRTARRLRSSLPRPCACSPTRCPRRCRVASSSPAASRMRKRRSTSTRSTRRPLDRRPRRGS